MRASGSVSSSAGCWAVVIGGGTGWRGAVLVLCIVCCMTAGGFAGIALWNPDPNSFVMLIPAGIGVTVGLFVGLGWRLFWSASCSGHAGRTIQAGLTRLCT